jgi:hypothetical protein
MRTRVMTPTTPPAIHAPCQSEREISLMLETPLGKPIPEMSLELKEHPVKKAGARRAAARK